MKKFTIIIIITISLFSCTKDENNNTSSNFISVKINNNEKAGKGVFPSLPFDEGNYYSLRNKEISFTGGDNCFTYGGSIQFDDILSSINWISGNAVICNPSYEISSRDTKTYANVEIIRNDNAIGGIIEGKINGVCSRCDRGTTWECSNNYYNYYISFRLKIVD